MYEIDRREALILPAAVGLAAFPLKARAQDVADLSKIFEGAEDVFRKAAINRTDEFSPFFSSVWQLRTALSFAVLVDGSGDALQQILLEAEDRLRKDLGDDISDEVSAQVTQNSVKFQNTAMALGTNVESGEVRIESGIFSKVRELVCPLYPFC